MKKEDCLILPPKQSSQKCAIVLLHGLGGDAQDVLPFAQALQERFAPARLLLPTAPLMPVTLNAGAQMPCWYDVISLDPPAIHCRQLMRTVEQLRGLINELISEGLETRDIFVIGFSQGGSVALAYGLLHARRLGGIACLAGFLPPCPELTPIPKRAWPLLLMHGRLDEAIPLKYCLQTQDALAAYQPTLKIYDLEHTINDEQLLDDLAGWLLDIRSALAK